MNSKFLHLLLLFAVTAMIGLGSLRAQSAGDTHGNTASVRQADAVSESQSAANAAIANDRDAVRGDASGHFHSGWVGLIGLVGLLGLFRRDRTAVVRRGSSKRSHAA